MHRDGLLDVEYQKCLSKAPSILLDRVTAQVVAVQFNQAEGVQEHAPVMLAVADTLERCKSVVIARDGFLHR